MELCVLFLFALRFDVRKHSLFGVTATNCVDEIALAPKLSTPQLHFDARYLFEDFSGSNPLYDLCHLLGSVHRYGLYEEMHMILVCANLKKVQFIPFSDLKTRCFDAGVYLLIKHHLAILRRTDQVIDEHTDVVALVQIDTHRSTLTPQQAAGYLP